MAVTDETRRVARLRRAELADLGDATVVALASAWVETWDELEPRFSALADEIAAAYPEGATTAQLEQSERINQAMAETRARLEELADYAGGRIAEDINAIVMGAPPAALDTLRTQLPPGIAQAAVQFGGVNAEALAAIVVRTTSQITAQSGGLPASMEDAMKRRLTQGIVDGANPRVTARRVMRDTEGEFMGGLARASRIARTEQIDAHRAAHLATVEANADLVVGRIWLATPDARTCMSCVSMSGTEFPPDAFGPEDHPQGRCVFIDKLKPWSELGIDLPEADDVDTDLRSWFDNLTEDTQRSMLGPARWELWSNGTIGWDDLAQYRENPEWRGAFYETPVRDLRALGD